MGRRGIQATCPGEAALTRLSVQNKGLHPSGDLSVDFECCPGPGPRPIISKSFTSSSTIKMHPDMKPLDARHTSRRQGFGFKVQGSPGVEGGIGDSGSTLAQDGFRD